jgi:hypothetical protein
MGEGAGELLVRGSLPSVIIVVSRGLHRPRPCGAPQTVTERVVVVGVERTLSLGDLVKPLLVRCSRFGVL